MHKGINYIEGTLIKVTDDQSKVKECVYKKLDFYITVD